VIDRIEDAGDTVVVWAATTIATVSCPDCGAPSRRVHSRYWRSLADSPAASRPVTIRLKVRRFYCGNAECDRVTFAEQVEGLTSPKARRTPGLRKALEAIAISLAGRAGARLAARLGMRASRSSLIRLVRALPEPEVGPVRVLGVDDFAFRRGHTYGTILVDMDTHLPIDLLDTREAGPLRAWLEAHPEVEVICRDRAGAYTEAASTAAPDATQVADRYHLWANLVRAVEECLMHHRTALAESLELAETAGQTQAGDEATEPRRSQGRMATRARAHHRLVHELLAEGHSLREVTRRLGWSRNTVRRYANAECWQDMVTPHRRRPSKLDLYKPYLHAQWIAGRTNVRELQAEILAMGYTGSYANTAAYLTGFRTGKPAKSMVPQTCANDPRGHRLDGPPSDES
jgi:transposase